MLRLGLGAFLLMSSVDKFISPTSALSSFAQLFNLTLSPSLIMVIGACELVLSLLIIFGFYKTVTYGLGLILHVVTTATSYQKILSPFGENHLVIASIPILFAFIVLFLLRDFDTLWTLGKKKSLFAQ